MEDLMRKFNDLLNQFQEFDIFAASILLGYRGSKAHGTYRSNSEPHSIDDIDIMGVAISPPEYYLGLKSFEQFDKQYDEWDVVIYDIRKYFRLLLKCNPNVMSLLWLDNQMYLRKTEPGQILIDNRNLFVSKQAYKSFSGYAYGQLKRMTHFECHGYMGEKRKQLVQKHGYDTKNASHLVRLLEMGIEFLETGNLIVKRPNVSYLLDIKRGKYTLEQIQKRADTLLSKIERARDDCKLPDKPNFEKANELLVELIKTEFNNAGCS